MLGGYGGATRDKNVNGRLTSLCLIGGVDCKPGYTPDLKVQGGARIKKTLCVLGAATFKDIDISGNTSIQQELLVCGNIHTKGDMIIDGNLFIMGNIGGGSIGPTRATGQQVQPAPQD